MTPTDDALRELASLSPRVAEWCRGAYLEPPVIRSGCSADELADLSGSLAITLPVAYSEFLTSCREFRADGPGPPVHLFSPYTVLAYRNDGSTPERLLDPKRGVETRVLTVGLYSGRPLLLVATGRSTGQLLFWLGGEEVRFDGSSSMDCKVAFEGLPDLLLTVARNWQTELQD